MRLEDTVRHWNHLLNPRTRRRRQAANATTPLLIMKLFTQTITAAIALGTLSMVAVKPASAQAWSWGSYGLSNQQRQYQRSNGWGGGNYFGQPMNSSTRNYRTGPSNYRNGHSSGYYFGW